jgi:hypothetical protein
MWIPGANYCRSRLVLPCPLRPTGPTLKEVAQFEQREGIMSTPIEKSSQGNEPQTVGSAPTYEAIELRAYQLYVERGGAHGQDVEDWLQAERELVEKHSQPGQKAKAATG